MSDSSQELPSDLEELKLVIQRSPVLRALMEVAPDLMQEALGDETFRADTVLFREGEPADRAYAIWSGRLRVQHDMGSEPPLVMRECVPGDVVGEVSLFDDQPRSATVLVVEDSHLVSLSREDLQRVLMQKPEVSLALLGALSYRLRTSDEYLVAASRSADYLARRMGDIMAGGEAGTADAAAAGYQRTGLGILIQNLSEATQGVTGGLGTLTRALSSILDERGMELLDLVNSHAGRLSANLEQVRDWQRLESGAAVLNPEPVIVGALAEKVAARLTPMARSMGLRITVEVEPGVPMVIADEGLIGRMFAHLYQNAMRYTPDETAIEVEITHRFGREVQVSVTDRGPGVPPEVREAIFEPFVRGPGEGTVGIGVGLAFCRAVVQAHGGRIWVEEGPGGEGSAFMISLPTGSSS